MGDHATIEFAPGRYFAAIIVVDKSDSNWLCAVWKDPGGLWTIRYRFRYYVDGKVFDSSDRRVERTFQFPGPTTEEAVMVAASKVADAVAEGNDIHKLILRTDDADAIVRAMERERFFHFRKEAQ